MRYTSKFCKRPRAKSFSDSSIDEFIQTLLSKIIADSTERRGVHTLSEVRIYISFKKD